MKVLEFLTSNIQSLGCSVDGQQVLLPGDDETPVLIDGKKLVLPTNAVLDDNNWEDKFAFFPLCESVTAEQSEVYKWMCKMVKANIIEKSILLAETFFKLRASTDKKKSTYAKFLSKFDGVDEKTYADFKKLTESANVSEWVRIFVDRNEHVDGEQYLRVLYYTSTFFDSDNDDVFLMGVKMSSKARKQGIVAVMKEILLEEEQHIGSNGEAPNFEALMSLYIKFAQQYNKLTSMVYKDVKLPKIELGFAEHMDKIASYRGRIPPLPGNTGKSTIEKKKEREDIPFDVEEVKREQTQRVRREEPREDRYDVDEPTGLAIFSGNGRSSRRDRDDRPRSTGNPMERRLYTDDRRSRRDYDDEEDRFGGRSRRRDRNSFRSFSRDRDDRDDYRSDRRQRNDRRSKWGR